MGKDLLFVDVETTGLFSSDRVVSFAGIRVGQEQVLHPRFEMNYAHFVFDPGKKSHPRAEQVHGLDDWFLRHQPDFMEHEEDFSTLFHGEPIIVAHNITFDRQFLEREFAHAGLSVTTGGYYCTMQAYRNQEQGRASLNAILPRIGLSRKSEQHGAFEDAWLSLQVYRWLNGTTPAPFPNEWPPFSNARPVPPRPDPLPRRSRKKAAAITAVRHIHPAAEQLKPYALLLDFVARSDGRVESEIDVLTHFLKSERPTIDEVSIPDVVASWIDCPIDASGVHGYAKQIDDRDKLVDWLRKVALADSEVSRAEIEAVRSISEALNIV